MAATPKYSRTAMVLHWLVAVLVFSLLGIGWFMVDLPQGPARGEYFALHKSIGLSVFALLILRVIWRYRHRPPPLPATVPAWQRVLATAVHRAFYVALIVQPASGYLSSSFSGYSTRWFGIPLPQWGWKDAWLNERFTEIHVGCSIVIVVLVLMHVLGVVSHLLQGERDLLRRMLPW